MEENKIYLSEKEMPQVWYNILPDLPEPLPPVIHPKTREPVKPEDLAPIFPMSLIMQEFSPERWIEIPDDVLRAYKLYRPTPLHRARNLEKALKTKARIYFKNESVSPPGSHKPNTAIAQAYYNKIEGVKRLTTETGAGQWGSALAFACKLFNLECIIFMVKVSYYQKPYRRLLAQSWGAKMYPSPSDQTEFGRKILEKDPDSPGSLGIAISEAIETAIKNEDTKYSLGSVLNHVLLHQTIIGLETKKQLELIGEKPDVLIGCVGGGSNFGGFIMPFVPEKLKGKNIRFIAVEPKACPTLTKGLYRYDYGDTACTTPLLKMYTLGHSFIPPGIHAGGLRYHGDAPLICHLYKLGIIEARAYYQKECFEAGVLFAQTEGFLPAPETTHAIKAVIDEAKDAPEGKVIVYNHSGHGFFDLSAYEAYFEGKLEDYEYPEEKIKEALKDLPDIE
ncbi:MAG: TrpB-like pyridoxal phosphate-dependent enzyme [Candidatus Omnitrophica bacterium]|nr:TrpB-like pyridoxal phosphate-dependent enzyme [Candidatus Omnitrophota bacterium]MCM8806633.1 TrpB-like pyridoxal phosphate-dependent enzyme [Candidatus Omnitrophota bacterium]